VLAALWRGFTLALMNLGIVGAGSLGTALGERLGQAGHAIMFGGGTSAKDAAARQSAQVGSNADAAAFGDVVILAVPFAAIDAALADAGALAGRVVWSCVNALKPDLTGLAVGFDNSAAEEVARRVRVRVSSRLSRRSRARSRRRRWHTTGISPRPCSSAGTTPRRSAPSRNLVRDIGAHPADAGPLTVARYVEPAMALLVSLAYAGVPRDLDLRLLGR
jgi:8-hydroxy-5-deazaflavin:NADPH oxidoreductase